MLARNALLATARARSDKYANAMTDTMMIDTNHAAGRQDVSELLTASQHISQQADTQGRTQRMMARVNNAAPSKYAPNNSYENQPLSMQRPPDFSRLEGYNSVTPTAKKKQADLKEQEQRDELMLARQKQWA